ncbi:EscV/YscV/HrcV family type III secretion system export apparatus protein [Xanthomonas hyacinthi]|uniref:EscV/YscV/HrcV family type III secretion system export apparatus protein n=1 Tax=Xanthomonas hyacinthi TaxID=56455 RepID=A0A2S7ERC8_9XANT|nr:FHIPEP family type III secretion protein [Xanthomonas hyacinthi]PPU95661.1 EscV/YscV/HrcV family type III secretion system export apparatus protein [Xanthomonas hyacinthi]QGY78071.1 EscV/YscV/HrcV family type III secretion system export apparatus protein [Xanthomonas hyacinthi]
MRLTRGLRYGGEAAIALLVVAVVALMILPLPTALIDALLGVNISLSVVLLMATMYVPDSLALSSFPSLLLFTTLLRLSLNIASTKSILLHANAGHIIDSFGKLVVGGNLVVGMVIFLIITTVQFIVIAKGSERVAEVGARFTLDAMPGKQMSIDADLRGGNLSAEDARRKRARLALESQLHGGMDGAMKFVKGDAIAGLVITLVNIVAGIIIGITYHGMSAAEAANRFAILSIGDAMVSQIASLLISVSAGIMITRAGDENDAGDSSLGNEIGKQLTRSTQALFSAGGMLACFALVPGFPAPLFLLLAATIAGSGYWLRRRRQASTGPVRGPVSGAARRGSKGQTPTIGDHAPDFAAALSVRLAADLADRLEPETLSLAIEHERTQLVEELGLPFPGVSLWRTADLQSQEFEVLVHDVPVQRECLAPTTRPEAELARQATRPLRERAHQFLGLQEAQWVLEQINAEYPGLVAEVQKSVPLQRTADVLRRLLEERVPIRNIKLIMESLVIWGPKEKDPVMLTEYVRGDLGAFLAHRVGGGAAQLPALLLEQALEQAIRQAIKPTPAGNFLTMAPEDAKALTERIIALAGETPSAPLALVTSMDIRRYVRRMIEARIGWLPVHSYQELNGHIELAPIGRIGL